MRPCHQLSPLSPRAQAGASFCLLLHWQPGKQHAISLRYPGVVTSQHQALCKSWPSGIYSPSYAFALYFKHN